MNVYGVYLCGPTDCFLSALFVSRVAAEEWAIVASTNPEGYLVRSVRVDEIIDELLEVL